MGKFGRWVTERELPGLRAEYAPDFVIAQAENVTHGSGINRQHYGELKQLGVDGFTSGNHIFKREDIQPLLDDPTVPITRPANYPAGNQGVPYKTLSTSRGEVILITLMGQIVGKDADVPANNPLHDIDNILQAIRPLHPIATIVNFHGDYSSEKVVIGQYLDGKVTAVIGDHWHIPTADARILSRGTAHMSDVGMVGARDSSLGVDTEIIVRRWREEEQGSNQLSERGVYQFSGALVDVDETTGLARDIQHIFRSGVTG
jgi:metallophosphoesterase (TIGR00282 family)